VQVRAKISGGGERREVPLRLTNPVKDDGVWIGTQTKKERYGIEECRKGMDCRRGYI
jgi:hypothetical protein